MASCHFAEALMCARRHPAGGRFLNNPVDPV